ncbi:hypothetical protein JW898_00710 [Candidatus Woesearchaeota archaeon]|nr:hypothetical protein [Candidatus Woesearchaeota archaeon]
MDLLARKRLRDRKREEERLKKLQEEEIFKKPEKAYVPSSKKLTIIMFIIFIIGIPLAYFKSELVMSDECGIMPGIECTDLRAGSDRISFYVSNYLKEDLNITIRLEGCEEAVTNYIKPNQGAEYSFSCAMTCEKVEKKINITYVGFSGLPHDKTGYLQAKLE